MKRKRCPRYSSYSAKALTFWRKHRRKIQRYYCLDCHKSFSERAGRKSGKRYELSLILKAADLYLTF